MNTQTLVPLIAFFAYIPLFGILLAHRPWQRQHKLLVSYLVPALLWSFSAILFRSDFFMQNKLLLVKVVLCTGLWMGIGFYCFFCSFCQTQGRKAFLAYVWLASAVVLAFLGYLPRGITITAGGIRVDYGIWLFLLAGSLAILFSKGIYSLVQKFRFSSDAAERNQIGYLFFAMSTLAIFGFVSFTPFGGRYPLAHVGNLAMACILTYAVVRHHLLDVGLVFRRVLSWLILGVIGVVIFTGLFFLAHYIVGFDINLTIVASAVSIAIIAAISVYKLLGFFSVKVEQAFVGRRYSYRKQLLEFISKIHNVPTLEELGSEFMSLLAQSVDCRRACLLLPQAGDGGFSAQFIYPPVEDNPMGKLKLRPDSPVVNWLERESTILQERDLDILPEFQSVWQEEREEIQSAEVKMFVPLMHEKKLVAVVAISERRDGKLYAVEDIDLLESITAQVAASMEKEYFHEQLREQGEEITLVNRLTAIITSSVSIQMIFEGFAEELKKVVDIDWATIALIEGSELYFVALSSTIGSAWQTGERIPFEGTATQLACRDRKAVYEPDLKRYHRFWTWESHVRQGVRSVVYLPLSVTDRIIGSLILASRKPNAYSRRQIKLLEKVALQIAAPIENAQLYARLEQKSRIDELTGLFNRRHFEERLKEELSRHSRYGDAFSILMIDLDNFKAYNDVYGHPAGDILLGQIGKIIKSSVRNIDQAFRYGGDEFVVILPQTTRDDAYIVGERVRGQLAREMEKKAITVTCSIGLASYPSDGVISGELVDMADTALYNAKRTGGNRIFLSSKISLGPPDDGGIPGIDTRRDSLSAVYDLVSTVETRDPYTYGHSKKVNTYAVALAEAIGLSPEDVSKVSTAALLHDIGKIGIPDKVLNKKGKLSKEDWEAIKSHPRLGASIVGSIPNLVPCVSSVLHHHERWDGDGYPEGLKSEEIPLEARILAIADSFEAMTSARPYRPPLSIEEVIKELRQGAGLQFDPKLVEVFIGIIEAGFPEGVKIGQDSSSEQAGL
jgi:diguanylate cyclase (GGDEF)-like protein/putative nucleotidyltransferase with HDIG domain